MTTTMAFGWLWTGFTRWIPPPPTWPTRPGTEDGHRGRCHAPGAAGERCLPILPPPSYVSTFSTAWKRALNASATVAASSGTAYQTSLTSGFHMFDPPKVVGELSNHPKIQPEMWFRWWHAGAGGWRLFGSIARIRGILEVGRRSEAGQRSSEISAG